jgi:hypothetical protein
MVEIVLGQLHLGSIALILAGYFPEAGLSFNLRLCQGDQSMIGMEDLIRV